MAVISFQFSHSADQSHQKQVLGRLKKVAGVRSVGQIDAESHDQDISRMCYAETTDDASNVASIVEELQREKGVETVSVEPRRGLIQ